jgi:hypothetical protein
MPPCKPHQMRLFRLFRLQRLNAADTFVKRKADKVKRLEALKKRRRFMIY